MQAAKHPQLLLKNSYYTRLQLPCMLIVKFCTKELCKNFSETSAETLDSSWVKKLQTSNDRPFAMQIAFKQSMWQDLKHLIILMLTILDQLL